MAFDYVNFSGLSHFYDKIKTKFASKDDLANKMDKSNPTGTGSLSLNRESGTTIGTNSIALGTYNGATASGNYSVALGGYNWSNGKKLIASGYQSTAIGAGAQSTANDTVAIGTVSSASGNYSMALGFGSKANGSYSVAMNRGTTNGSGSVAIGKFTVTNGDDSTAIGLGTVTGSDFQTVLGKYNIEDTSGDYVYIVGNGSDSARSNAHTLDWDGNAEFSGDVIAYGCGGTTPISLNELNSRPVNNNILINSNFANPVNQRGVANLTSSTWDYWIDRWKIMPNNNNTEYKIVDNGIQICPLDANGGIIYQYLEFPELYLGKTLTASICVDGTICTFTATFPAVFEDFFTHSELIDGIEMNLGIDTNVGTCYIGIHANEIGKSKIIQWAKLELGEVATPYVPRLYSEELRLCKRYYQKVFVSFPITFYETNSVTATSTIPCEPMRIDRPTCDTTQLSVLSNGFATSGFVVDNCVVVTSQNKFYCRSNKNSHGLTLSNNVFTQGLLTMDAEF